MTRSDPHEPEWDPEDSVGVVYSEKRRRWVRGRNVYSFYLTCLVAIVLLMGLIAFFSPLRLVGLVAFAAAPYVITLSDRAARTDRTRELLWLALAVALVAAGLALFGNT